MTWPSLPTRERDALVAEKVMGWKLSSGRIVGYWESSDGKLLNPDFWRPSTSIADAFKVVEKMREEGLAVDMVTVQTVPDVGRWSVAIFNHEVDAEATSNSLPEAICLASLRAKGVEV